MCGVVKSVLCVVWWSVFYEGCGGVCSICGVIECVLCAVFWSVYYVW